MTPEQLLVRSWSGAGKGEPVQEQAVKGRRYAAAALAVYAVAVLFIPGTWGGSLALAPVGALFAAVSWRRDRPSRLQLAAFWVTRVAAALALLLLIFHLIWGDLS